MNKSEVRNDRPTWAPRVPRHKVAQLYAKDAQGIRDEDLIDEVGIGLLARVNSIFASQEASRGKARCPICEDEIYHSGNNSDLLRCKPCNWELTWGEYRRTKQRKQLAAAGVVRALREYAGKYPSAKSAREKMMLIDGLIHAYHQELEKRFTRPGAVNLIAGKQYEVLDLLNNLAYGDGSTPELLTTRDAWFGKVKKSREWVRASADKRRRKHEDQRKRAELKRKVREQQKAVTFRKGN